MLQSGLTVGEGSSGEVVGGESNPLLLLFFEPFFRRWVGGGR